MDIIEEISKVIYSIPKEELEKKDIFLLVHDSGEEDVHSFLNGEMMNITASLCMAMADYKPIRDIVKIANDVYNESEISKKALSGIIINNKNKIS